MKEKIFSILLFINSLIAFGQSANEFYMKGVSKFLSHQNDSADFYLDKAIVSDNSEVLYHLKKGEVLLAQNKTNEAIVNFEKANQIKNNVADLWISKSYALVNKPAEAVSYLQKHLTSVYKKSEKEIKTDDAFNNIQNSDEWFTLWENEWYTEEEKTEEDVDYLLKNQDHLSALSLIDSKIKTSKNKETLYKLRARVFAEQGNPKAAAMDYGLAMEKNKSPELFKARGDEFFKAGNFNEAIADYSTALRYDAADFTLYLKRAESFSMVNNLEAAIKDMETYLNYFPNDKDALYACGEFYFRNDGYIGALKYFNKNLALDNTNPGYFKARGKTYFKTRMYKLALDDLSMALDLYPNDGESYYYKGMVRLKTSDNKGACDDWKKAVQLGERRAIEALIDNCK